MSEISEKKMKSIKEEIGQVVSRYTNLIENLSEMKDSKINNTFWDIRADLEAITIELKSILQKEILIEKWQSKFHEELKGTKSKEKAMVLLSKYNKDENQILDLLSTDLEQVYHYLWKLKEAITVVFEAFPLDKFTWVNGELQENSEKVFEI